METLASHINRTQAQSKEHLTFVKSASQLNISAEVDLMSSDFHALKIDVKKFPLVFAAGARATGPLVIDYNFEKLGKLECNYIPKVIVLSGINAARHAKDVSRSHGVKAATAWIGTRAFKSLDIKAADVSSALQAQIYKAVRTEMFKGSIKASAYTDSPYVIEVYQLENYAVLGWQGQKFRQRYTIDAASNLHLDGDMIPVVTMKADGIPLALVDEGNRGVTQGGFNGRQFNVFDSWRDFGAPGSEANNPMLKMMLNVEEALKCYLTEIATGVWRVMYPGTAVTPPNMLSAATEAKIAASEAKVKDFSVMDFLKWQDKKLNLKAAMQTKDVNGEMYSVEDFAYVGAARDVSTWFVPVKTSSEINAASKTTVWAGVPKSARRATLVKIQATVEAMGTHTSGRVAAGNPHKFVMDADHNDMCKKCNCSSAHPIHKVK